MRQPPQRRHPKCQDHGCRSYNHLVCPAECELLWNPEPEERQGVISIIPMSVLKLAPTIAIT